MKIRQKLPVLSIFLALILLLSSCSMSPEDQQQAFDAFIENDFVTTMESDYLTNHIYLENPEDYGVDESQIAVSLGSRFSPESFQETRDNLEALEKEFSKFDRDSLTPEQQVTYDIYKAMLDLAKTGNQEQFDYYASYFDSMTGIHTSLPTLFSDLTLRDEQDVKDVILLMQDVRPYVQSLLDYVKAQEEHGTLMVDTDEVISQCEQYTQSGENSPILTSMFEHIDALNLESSVAQGYKDQLREAFVTSFLPAYQDIIDTMEGLDPAKNNTQGLANLEHGKEYYEYLFQDATGSSHSIEEVEEMLYDGMERSLNSMVSVYMLDSDTYEAFLNGDYATSFTDYQAMMDFLTQAIGEEFPAIGDVEYTLNPLDEELANSGIAAYFNIPAIDGTTPMSIFVNTTSGQADMQALETFTTVAHEGIPGHLYMTVYQNEHLPNAWRKTIPSFLGYSEGYATYVEMKVLDYLDLDSNAVLLQRANTLFSNCAVALIDIGIHYHGWDLQDLEDFAQENGLNVEAMPDIYAQIQSNPTAFLSYYVGYLEFEELYDHALAELGNKFDLMAFHEAILSTGSAPFQVVANAVEEYIQSAA